MKQEVKDTVIELFTQISLFKSFSAKEISTKFFQHGFARIIEYQPAETIISEGKYDNWMYWLISGKVDVIKNNCHVATLQRVGDMFGEMGILEGDARSASVYASTSSICLAIDMSILDHPELERKISRNAFCKDVAYVTKSRLATTTNRLTEAEQGLEDTKQLLAQSEQKLLENRQILKKTLGLLEEKDTLLEEKEKEIAMLKDRIAKLENSDT